MISIVSPLLRIQNQLRIYHWQTTSYTEHKAFGKAYENLDDLIDTFIEAFFGKYGRSKAKLSFNIELRNYEDGVDGFIDTSIDYLRNFNSELDTSSDSELLNIRDEMIAEFDRLKYLLTLK